MDGSLVTIATTEGPMDAFVALPKGGGPFPGVVVAQEAFGVNDHIRGVCPAYHAASAADAWRRTAAWLGTHLRRGT